MINNYGLMIDNQPQNKCKVLVLKHSRQQKLVNTEQIIELYRVPLEIGCTFVISTSWDYIEYKLLDVLENDIEITCNEFVYELA